MEIKEGKGAQERVETVSRRGGMASDGFSLPIFLTEQIRGIDRSISNQRHAPMEGRLTLVPVANEDARALSPAPSHLELLAAESLHADDGLDGRHRREKLDEGGKMGQRGDDDGQAGVVRTGSKKASKKKN